MLSLNNIEVIYNEVILVLKGLSLKVNEGQIAALLGTNGAGKSTTLKAISGLLKPERGEVTDGSVDFIDERIDLLAAEEVVRRGIFQVMEGRRVFEHLNVEENLMAGGYTRPRRADLRRDIDRVYGFFPRLRERLRSAGGLSLGGRAADAGDRPRPDGTSLSLMLLDEPSLGLAPLLVQEIFDIIKRINDEEGTSILLVEQNATLALEIADYGYIMEGGRVVLEGEPAVLKDNADVKEFYLGLTQVGEKKSYRDVKHYKRRKRWLS